MQQSMLRKDPKFEFLSSQYCMVCTIGHPSVILNKSPSFLPLFLIDTSSALPPSLNYLTHFFKNFFTHYIGYYHPHLFYLAHSTIQVLHIVCTMNYFPSTTLLASLTFFSLFLSRVPHSPFCSPDKCADFAPWLLRQYEQGGLSRPTSSSSHHENNKGGGCFYQD